MSAPSSSRKSEAWKGLRLKYTTPELLFHRIDIDATCDVLVIGGDGEGAYEWVIQKDGKVESHSDVGYGTPVAALRDGLIKAWPPSEPVTRSETTRSPLAKELLEATAIGMATIFTRCGAYETLSPYLKGKYDQLSALHKLACDNGAWPSDERSE